jgi:hypothetical protein
MKVSVLFDDTGTIYSLFIPSGDPSGPQVAFRPGPGHRTELLEVPAQLRSLRPAALHRALRVDLAATGPRLVSAKP